MHRNSRIILTFQRHIIINASFFSIILKSEFQTYVSKKLQLLVEMDDSLFHHLHDNITSILSKYIIYILHD